MFTQFNDHTSQATLPKPNADWQKWEAAIMEVNKISDARISYNEELKKFFLESSLDDIENFYKNTVEKFSVSSLNSLSREKILLSLKESMVLDISAEICFYEAIKKRISNNPHSQEMIDTLHFLFSRTYEMRRFCEKSEQLKKQAKKNFYETNFLRETLNALDPLISEIEVHYMSDHEFSFSLNDKNTTISVVPQTQKKTHLINKYSTLFEKCKRLLVTQTAKCSDDNKELCEALGVLIKNIIEKDGKYKTSSNEQPADVWHIYRKAYEGYADALESMREIEKHPLLSSRTVSTQEENPSVVVHVQKSKNATKNEKRRQKLKSDKEKVQERIVVDVAEDEQASAVEFLETQSSFLLETLRAQAPALEQETEESKDRNEFVDSLALKTKVWKEEVAWLKIEKQNAIDEKNRQERLYFEQQKKFKEDSLANKEEHEYKNACELLGVLNPNNRTLIEQMFQKPTPHCKVRYQEIESLFGEGTGKLPGIITAISGSHRKICIQSTVGFFDEFYVAEANATGNVNKTPGASELENKTKSAEVVGGMFKAHKSGQGNSMLPSVAIKMICSTLERVGITAESIARYKQEKVSQRATFTTD